MVVPPHTNFPPRTNLSGAAIAAAKAALRGEMRKHRAALGHYPPLPTPVQWIATVDQARAPGTLATYLPLAGEADPAHIVEAARTRGWRLALPHVTTRGAPMRFLRWAPDEPTETGPMRLRQPRADAEEYTPDIILTPLLAFDGAGRRLGQGGGFYDGVFVRLPHALRIGIAWSFQCVPMVPVDARDAPLHATITENGWMEFR